MELEVTGTTRRSLLHHIGGAAAVSIARCVGIDAAAAESSPDEIDRSERDAMTVLAKAFMRNEGVPGLAVAIARNGQFVYTEGFGVADQEIGESMTPSHLFRIAGVSETLTSVAIFTLIELGQLKLDDKVFGAHGILQTDFGTRPYDRYVESVTVEHLLTHTAGGWSTDADDAMFSNPRMNHRQLISRILDEVPLLNRPGSKFAFSNFGFCVLGRVIEKVAGQPYAEYVGDAVLRECGITEMRIAGNTLAARAPGEVVYYGQRGADPYALNVARMDSYGGWLASAVDLVRFATYVDDALKPETVATMMAPSTANSHYARGWSVSGRSRWHSGSLEGACSIMVRHPSGFRWAALANSRRAEPDTVQAIDQLVWSMARAVKSWGLS